MIGKYFAAAIAVLLAGAFLFTFGADVLAESEITPQSTGGGHNHHMHAAQPPDVIVDLETQPGPGILAAGVPAKIIFSLKDSDGKPLQDLAITHERLLHVIIASRDFSVFAHIHPEDFGPITPEMKKAASFPVQYAFPMAGEYIVALDSAVRDVSFSRHFSVAVVGEPRMGPLAIDLSRRKKFGEYDVTLSTAPVRITAGKETTLKYRVSKGGEPVKGLEPYLSAYMHLAIIKADLSNFIHTHGELPGEPSGDHTHAGHTHQMSSDKRFGPEIDVRVIFPLKGTYQIFGEIKHLGKIIPLSFMIEAE